MRCASDYQSEAREDNESTGHMEVSALWCCWSHQRSSGRGRECLKEMSQQSIKYVLNIKPTNTNLMVVLDSLIRFILWEQWLSVAMLFLYRWADGLTKDTTRKSSQCFLCSLVYIYCCIYWKQDIFTCASEILAYRRFVNLRFNVYFLWRDITACEYMCVYSWYRDASGSIR